MYILKGTNTTDILLINYSPHLIKTLQPRLPSSKIVPLALNNNHSLYDICQSWTTPFQSN